MSDTLPFRYETIPETEMLARGEAFRRTMAARRSVREFSDRAVPRDLIECAIRTAASAPSGANMQPWHFVAVSDPAIKRRIRAEAEKAERDFYEGSRGNEAWLADLAPLGTDWHKPFIETAPWLVAVFEEVYRIGPDAKRRNNYYTRESVGIACGLFIASLHTMGLVTLTHTPAPMHFLSKILGRPKNERPYILFPVGYPAEGATVPNINRKPIEAVSTWLGT